MTQSWQVWKDYWCNCGPISGALSIFENIHSNQTGGGSVGIVGVSTVTITGLDLHEVPDYIVATIANGTSYQVVLLAYVDLSTLTTDGFTVDFTDGTGAIVGAVGDTLNYIYGWNP